MRGVLAFALAVVASAGCTAMVPDEAPKATAQPLACVVPKRILDTPSPSAEALKLWSTDPVGSPRARAALEAACTDSDRGTEQIACVVLALTAKDPATGFRHFSEAGGCKSMGFSSGDLAQAQEHSIKSNSVGCCGGYSCEKGCEEQCRAAVAQVTDEIGMPLRRACARGQAAGCYMLAELVEGQYLQNIGHVVIPDPRGANTLYEAACSGGIGPACEFLGWRTEDLAKRHRDLERACFAGWGDACLHLGTELDEHGNRAAALGWWEKSCRLGQYRVCSDLGDILAEGEGVRVDQERASRMRDLAWSVLRDPLGATTKEP